MHYQNTTRHVVIISDLHLGGDLPVDGGRGFRMNSHANELRLFLESLSRKPEGSIELVINGDFVDVLAERRQGQPPTLDPYAQGDRDIFARLIERDRRVFEALGHLLERRHRVTILLGNHDVELSLPTFRRIFEDAVGRNVAHLIRYIDDNQAYVIDDVLIEHGNRYDGFNTIAHDELRRLRSLDSRHDRDPRVAFPPPPGSQLVVDVMNAIKKDYPFIDLLKPETSAAVPLLLAFEPRFVKYAAKIAKLAVLASRRNPKNDGTIRHLTNINSTSSSDASDAAVTPEVAEAIAHANRRDVAAVEEVLQLLEAEAPPTEATTAHVPMASNAPGALSQLVSFIKLVAGADLLKRIPALRRALEAIRDDRSFVLAAEDDKSPYRRAADQLAKGSIRYVIFGHTHLAKTIDLGTGRTYINTGTWADLAALPLEELIGDGDEELARKVTDFLEALRLEGTHDWIQWAPHYATFTVDEHGNRQTPPQLVRVEAELIKPVPTANE